ncbi:TPA: protein-export chaperone SecB [Morganella morganii]|nr:protein-export chaperone SecB [Morganella morganii]HCU0876307.1 protein-export chaperone SecB [Morganella morganii]
MKIQLKDNILDSFKLEKKNPDINRTEDSLTFGFNSDFSEENQRNYDIIFNMEFEHKDGVVFHVVYRSRFTTDENITQEFKNSPFIFINSPAIAYPFLRAFVANIMLLSGYDPIMLPTVNFQKLYNDNKEKLINL